MASIMFTAKDIFDQDFKREVRGYNKDEVNEFLDDVIQDRHRYLHQWHHNLLRLLLLMRINLELP